MRKEISSVFEKTLETLNPEQRQAVDHIDGPLVVLAGAGTGKTQILAMRIAHILRETQMAPHNILCLTFTETGTAAMRNRLLEIIGPDAYYVGVNTFHSFCNDVIQEHPEKFLSTNDLEPLSDIERVTVMQAVLDTLPVESALKPFGAPYFYLHQLLSAMQTLKRENVDIADYRELVKQLEEYLAMQKATFEEFIAINGRSLTAAHCDQFVEALQKGQNNSAVINDFVQLHKHYNKEADDDKTAGKQRTQFKQAVKRHYEKLIKQLPKQQALGAAYEHYQAELKKRGRYDYEDMLLFVVNAFETDDELLAEYQEQFQYILVDEYQDTNGAQNRVVELLGSYFEDPNIFVVGDDRQSIYRFQGASLENILYFTEKYGSTSQVVSLKQNYRSHQIILNAAHNLVSQNETSVKDFIPNIETALEAATKIKPTPIQIGEFETPDTEHYWLGKKIQQLVAAGVKPSEIAVLYRNNHDVDDVMDVLEYLEVPFHLEAGLNILQDRYIVQFISLLRFIASQGTGDELFYLLHYDFLHIEPLAIVQLQQQARQDKAQRTLFQIALEEKNVDKKIKDFCEQLAGWRTISANETFARFFEQVLEDSGFLDFIMQQPEKVEHLNRVNTLLQEIKHMNRLDPAMGLVQFVEYLDLLQEHSLVIEERHLQTQKEAVRLMTAHKAKGLEFEHVFIIKCVDKHWGNVPNRSKLMLPPGILHKDPAADVKEKNEDERRLMYVAMTRAKQQLYITFPKHSPTGRQLVPSLFLLDINEKHRVSIDTAKVEDEGFERLQTMLLRTPTRDYSAAEQDYLKSVLENYTMSATHLNDYLNCPRLFYYQDVLHVPQPKNRAVSFGVAMHNTLRDVSMEFAQTNKLPTTAAVLKNFEQHLEDQLLNKRDYKDSLEFGKQTLALYYNEHKKRLGENLFPEIDFSSHGIEIDGVPITGKIDAIQIVDEASKQVHVIDYKTGNPDNKSGKLAKGGDYQRQLLFYKLLCDRSPKFKYTVVSGEINFIQPSETASQADKGNYAHRQFELAEVAATELAATIVSTYQDIKNLKFLDPEPDKYCNACRYCKIFG